MKNSKKHSVPVDQPSAVWVEMVAINGWMAEGVRTFLRKRRKVTVH